MSKVNAQQLIEEYLALSDEERRAHPDRELAELMIRQREIEESASDEDLRSHERVLAKHTSGVGEPPSTDDPPTSSPDSSR